MGTPCICGAASVQIDARNRKVKIGDRVFGENDFLSIDGTTGEVLDGKVATQDPEPDKNFKKLMSIVDKLRKLNVRANADTPEDAKKAREFGAEGIGLCRTEHMFFAPDRIGPMRQMILSHTAEGRKAALKKLEPFQRADFKGLFKAMKGLPVTIRLLDPPLHEFLPHSERDQKELAREMGFSFEDLRDRVHGLHEMNPMLGHRGCR